MSGHRRYTRSDRFGKRQKNKRKLLFFSGLSILFLIVFVSLLLFGNKGNPKEAGGEQSEETDDIQNTEENAAANKSNDTESNGDNSEDSSSRDTTITPEESDEEEETVDVTVEEIPSDDENVITAYRGNWEPVGTKQDGPHNINYNDGSDDRIEIKQAVAMVTELESDNIVEHWIGRGGDQAVIATVYDINSQDDIFRVYLQWIDEEGWQPTKMEKLKHF